MTHKMGGFIIKPEYIYISGPSSTIRKIKYLYTEPINLTKQTKYIEKDLEINISAYPTVKISESNVKVFIPIYSMKDLLALKIPIIIESKDNNYNYSIVTTNVTVYVKPTDNSVLSPEKTERILKAINVKINASSIDLKKISRRKKIVETFMPLNMYYQNNVEKIDIITFEPKSVKIKISKK